MGIFTKREERASSIDQNVARKRARMLSTPDLANWAEAVAMNQQAAFTKFMVTGDHDALLETIIMHDSLGEMLAVIAERVVR
jgi:hypothetical protein